MQNLLGMVFIFAAWAAIAWGLVGMVSPLFAMMPSRWFAATVLSSSTVFAGLNSEIAMPNGRHAQGAAGFMLALWVLGCCLVMVLRRLAERRSKNRQTD